MNLIVSAFLVFLFMLPSAFADIPDNILNSDSCSYLRLRHPGREYLVEVLYSEADSITRCFGYSISGDSITHWTLSIDHEGVLITWKDLPSLMGQDREDSTEFSLKLDNDNTLYTCGEYDNEHVVAITRLLDPKGNEVWERYDWYNDRTTFASAAVTPVGGFLMAGWTGEELSDTNVLLAVISRDGCHIVGTEILIEDDQTVHAVILTETGQVIVTGLTSQPDGEETDVFFLRLGLNELSEKR